MKIMIAYFTVVMIWSTTPLAIKWSNSSLSALTALSARVWIAFLICSVLLLLLRKPLVQKRSDWLAYCAGLLGLFPTMVVVYWSARHIPSGLAAVIFGMYPFTVGLFSFLLLKENMFNVRRVVALFFALAGLVVINLGQIGLGGNALYGALGMFSATFMFGLSSVWLKKVGAHVDPLRQSAGVLFLAAPLLALTWWGSGDQIPSTIDQRSISGVLYLAIAGSVLGGTLFFYVLKNCSVATVGLITFVSPIMSLMVGAVVDGERFSLQTGSGCMLVILALAIYQNVFTLFGRVKRNMRLSAVRWPDSGRPKLLPLKK